MVELWNVVTSFWFGEPAVVRELSGAPNRLAVSLWIVVLAGLSEALSQSVVLFANRVRPVRFVLSLLASGVLTVINYLAWVTSLFLAINVALDVDASWRVLAICVAISFIPLVFSFIALLPYLGHPLQLLLYATSFVGLVRALDATFVLTTVQSIGSAALGLVLILLLRATVGRPLVALEKRLRNATAGKKLENNLQVAIDDVVGDGKFRR